MKYLIQLITFIALFSCTQEQEKSSVKSNKSSSKQLQPSPTLVSLTAPNEINSLEDNIQITVSGISSGNSVKLYTDSSCSNEVSSQVASSSEVVFDLALTSFGPYTFYATQESSINDKSACSSSYANYVYENSVAPTYMDSVTFSSPQGNAGTSSTISVSVSGVSYGHTIKLFSDSSCSTEVGSEVASSSTVTFSLNLGVIGDYEYYANSTNNYGVSNCVGTHNYSLGEIPSAPNSLTVSPGAIGLDTTPTITVGGISNGDTVRIFTDSNCSQQAGSAVSSSTSVSVDSDALTSFSVYNYYATTSNSFGESECSSATVSYDLRSEPFEYPAIAVADMASKRANFVNCGENEATIDDKIASCAMLNDGATVDVGNSKIWKQVTKIGTDELWLDVTTGLIWSPHSAGKADYNSNACNWSNVYGVSGVTWRLPTKSDFQGAEADSMRSVIYMNSNSGAWSSTSGSGYWGPDKWVYYFTTGNLYALRINTSSTNNSHTMCIFDY